MPPSQPWRSHRRIAELEAEKERREQHIEFLERELATVRLDVDNVELALRSERRKVATLKGEAAAGRDSDPQADQVVECFEEWRAKCNHPRSKLGPKRQEVVLARLRQGYSVEDIKLAILGASRNAFEKAGKRYDDLELICRNEVNLERFMGDGQRIRDADTGAPAQPDPVAQMPAVRPAEDGPWEDLAFMLRQIQNTRPPESTCRETGAEVFTCPKCHTPRALALLLDSIECRSCDLSGARQVIAALREQAAAA